MNSLLQKLNDTPYWLLTLVISVAFGAGLFVVFAITEGLDAAIKVAGPLTLLSVVGFAIVRYTMPGKNN